MNVTQMVLFKSPRDQEQIGVLSRQMEDRRLLIDAYKKAALPPSGHLMIDFDSHTVVEINFCSCSSGTEPSVLLVSSSNTKEYLTNESTKAFSLFFIGNMKPIVRRLYRLHCSKEKINFSCNCLFNIVTGHIAMAEKVSQKKLERHRRLTEILCNKQLGLMPKRQILSASHGLKLLALIQSSISRHLEIRHGIER